MLASFGTSQKSAFELNAFSGMGGFANPVQGVNQAMNFVEKHPYISKAIGIAYPPAGAAITALETANTVKKFTQSEGNEQIEQAGAHWSQGKQQGESVLQTARRAISNTPAGISPVMQQMPQPGAKPRS